MSPLAFHQHPLWHVSGAALFILLVLLHRRANSSAMLIMFLWNLSGVILHESAHLLAGLVFRAHPSAVSLIPHKTGAGWRLGSVSFRRITTLNAVPVALAPLALVPLACFVARKWSGWYPPSLAATLALYAALFILLYNSLPSRQDLRVACNWKSILVYAPALLIACWLAWPVIGRSTLAGLTSFIPTF